MNKKAVFKELLDKFESAKMRIKSASKKILENRRLILKMYTDKQILRDPLTKINEKWIYLDHISKIFENSVKNVLGEKQQMLSLVVSKLEGLSPLGILSRGYSVAKDASGAVVKSISQVKPGDCMTVRVSDGEINTIVK